MSNSLLLIDNQELENIYGIHFNVYLSSDVMVKKSSQEIIDFLTIVPTVDVIIVKDVIGDDKCAESVSNWLNENDKEIPLIVLSNDKSINYAKVIDPSLPAKELVKITSEILGINIKDQQKNIISEFFPIPVFYFDYISKSCCDVYQRSGSSGNSGDSVYFKLFEMNKKIESSEVAKLMKNKIRHLYINTSQKRKFMNFYTDTLMKRVSSANPKDRMKSLEGARKVVADQIMTYGISKEVIALADKSITETISSFNKEKALKDFVKLLSQNSDSFLFQHSQLAVYISFHIVEHMEWGTQEHKDKLAFVSFFHDMALSDDELATVHSNEELEVGDFSSGQKERIKNHAQYASQMIANYPNLPMGADIIIKQHHGTHNGLGFKESPGIDISPLAAVFMVSEEFATMLLLSDKKPTTKEIMERMHKRFPKHPRFNALLDAFEKSLKTM
jgi:hypothetical protein